MSTSPSPEPLDRRLLVLMGVLLAGAFVVLFDTTIVAVAITDLTREFDATVSQTQWVASSYLLAMSATIPLMGWLSDRWGPRRVWLASLGMFLAGSVLCGLAWSLPTLIVARVFQGLGGGLVLPLIQSMLATAAGPARIGRVMGLIGIPGQLAPILGPVLGGLIIASLGWRWIFLVNAPVCLAAIALAYRYLDPEWTPRNAGLDRVGVALAVPATVLLVAGLFLVNETASVSLPVILAAAGAGLGTLYVLHALRCPDTALLDLRPFRHRSFSAANTAMFLSGVCLFGSMLLLPLFLRQIREAPAGEVGFLLAPQGVGLMIGLWAAGQLSDRIGPRPVAIAGTLLAAGGMAMFAVAGSAPLTILMAGPFIFGLGLAGIGVPVSAAAYRNLEPAVIPRATSVMNVVQRVGATFGTVVAAMLLQSMLAREPDAADAFARTFLLMLVFSVALLAVMFLLPSRPPAPAASHTVGPRTEEG